MSKWAPLVHGRTAYVDFRSNFIVLPKDFENADIESAKRYILTTTRSAQLLRGRPRWCAFRDRGRIVVGVTCMADEVSDTHNREVVPTPEGPRPGRRKLYVFLGLVSKDPIMALPPRDLAYFGKLYRHVVDRWEEKPYDSKTLHPEPYSYVMSALAPKADPEVDLNMQADQIKLWPCDRGKGLWRAADAPEASLALDLPSVKVATSSLFRNATVLDIDEPRIEELEPPRKIHRPQPTQARTPAKQPAARGTAEAPSPERPTSKRLSLPNPCQLFRAFKAEVRDILLDPDPSRSADGRRTAERPTRDEATERATRQSETDSRSPEPPLPVTRSMPAGFRRRSDSTTKPDEPGDNDTGDAWDWDD